MARKIQRQKLILAPEGLERLQHLRQSSAASMPEVQRAQVLTPYHAGETITQIARNVRMTRKRSNGSVES